MGIPNSFFFPWMLSPVPIPGDIPATPAAPQLPLILIYLLIFGEDLLLPAQSWRFLLIPGLIPAHLPAPPSWELGLEEEKRKILLLEFSSHPIPLLDDFPLGCSRMFCDSQS